ncbi:MAG TPA: nitrate/sulfonate/bicarbonate ABC transporter ATP-binding protein [Bryobacteraceae bacterium]|nr:nitrate/sulfonate/bicarbonate ABC transporter ATP-binding protein [Bryobacteraceae bacterium]
MKTEEPIIEARGIEKFYGPENARIQVVAPTDLAVYSGEILAVLGPSGSGKSTLLRMLTGLSTPSSGFVLRHGQPVAGPCPNVSIVFQSFALFPWLTVLDNVQAPLKARGVPPHERIRRSLKILDAVGLDGFEKAFPKELSGGMKQRVGFARALVVEPEVLFMDEPFSALDVLTAENLRQELLELWEDHKMPTRAVFLVTHNIEEAVLLADRVVVLGKNPGRIRTDFRISMSRPRDRHSHLFLETVDYIYRVLTHPELVPEGQPEPEAATDGAPPARAKYPMLPHARRGAIAGLLELLLERSGRDDLYHLADDLAFEIDDLLPIVEAGSMLGFLSAQEGDVEITPAGQRFAEAGILRRKELFRVAAIERVPLIRQISRSLEAKADHSLPEEFFRDMLAGHFSDEEIDRQLDTAVNWGRYAELFDRDAAAGQFFIPEETPSADGGGDGKPQTGEPVGEP